jgi:hypothetical protein
MDKRKGDEGKEFGAVKSCRQSKRNQLSTSSRSSQARKSVSQVQWSGFSQVSQVESFSQSKKSVSQVQSSGFSQVS